MKILELTGFSAGICGVWTRVKEESIRLAERGHEVYVFSSNITKGCEDIAAPEGAEGRVKIKRFPAKKVGGESFMKWDFVDEAVKLEPDVIIAHAYRHTHTTKAIEVAEKLRKEGKKCKVFLVTHGPFGRDNTRTSLAKWFVRFYDWFVGPKTLRKFDKIITITHWEVPYLEKLGISKEHMKYIPNGIPEEFFTQGKEKEEKKILFVGRISPIKSLETVISALPLLKDKKVIFEIVGPAEESYLKELKELIGKLGLEKRVKFSAAIFEIPSKIRKIDSAKIFVLPSKSEGMPQSLIEAMAREKIVIASDNPGAKDLVKDEKDGFLFKIGDEKDLAKKIDFALSKEHKNIREQARKDVEIFNWNKIIEKIEKLIKN